MLDPPSQNVSVLEIKNPSAFAFSTKRREGLKGFLLFIPLPGFLVPPPVLPGSGSKGRELGVPLSAPHSGAPLQDIGNMFPHLL